MIRRIEVIGFECKGCRKEWTRPTVADLHNRGMQWIESEEVGDGQTVIVRKEVSNPMIPSSCIGQVRARPRADDLVNRLEAVHI